MTENILVEKSIDFAAKMETFYTSDRKIWREWLAENFKTKSEIWFVFPMKKSGDKSLLYSDAVEEALCFSWIDSTIKHIDPTHRAQRFTPRKQDSPYSRPNIERLIWLDKHAMIHPSVKDDVLPLVRAPYVFPSDILETIKADTVAWENYEKLSEPYKRIRIAYIDAARKRPNEFKKRLESFIKKTREGKIIAGYGGINKYYN